MATITGPARNVLLKERIALNTLARCSGIAIKYVLLQNAIEEVQIEEGADEAITAGAGMIMLGNFDGLGLQKAALSICR